MDAATGGDEVDTPTKKRRKQPTMSTTGTQYVDSTPSKPTTTTTGTQYVGSSSTTTGTQYSSDEDDDDDDDDEDNAKTKRKRRLPRTELTKSRLAKTLQDGQPMFLMRYTLPVWMQAAIQVISDTNDGIDKTVLKRVRKKLPSYMKPRKPSDLGAAAARSNKAIQAKRTNAEKK